MNDYFKIKAISYSFLKALSSSFKEGYNFLYGKEELKSKALDTGSLIDDMLTNPEIVSEKYAIFQGTKPTDKLLDLAEKYVELFLERKDDEDYDDTNTILSARAEVGYDSRLKDDTLIKRFEESCRGYCTFLTHNQDKVTTDLETYNNCMYIVSEVKKSPYYKDLFDTSKNIKIFYQVPFVMKIRRGLTKALVDCIIVDYDTKTIHPIDVKTFEGDFVSNWWRYKYYYQEVWYYSMILALKNHESMLEEEFVNDDSIEISNLLKLDEFEVSAFKFLAIDKSNPYNVVIYKSYRDIYEDVFFKGRINRGNDTYSSIRSIQSLINEFDYRIKEEDWSHDYDMITQGFKQIQY